MNNLRIFSDKINDLFPVCDVLYIVVEVPEPKGHGDFQSPV